MRRRQYLIGTGILVAGFSGCTGSEEAPDGDPEAIVEAYYEGYETGDADGINDRLHSDGELDSISASELAEFEGLEFDLDETEVVEESADEAVVAVEGTLSHPELGQFSIDGEVVLRPDDGEWKIWDSSVAGEYL